MAKVFTYTKTPVSVDRLTQEIRDSAITVALDHINLFGDNLDIFFKADLSSADITILNAIVAAHTGEPLPGELSSMISVANQSGSYSPSPANFIVGKNPVLVDADNKLTTRGPTLTDEGSFREDFAGTSIYEELPGTFSFNPLSDEVTFSGIAPIEFDHIYPYIKLASDPDSALTQGELKDSRSISLYEVYRGSEGSGTAIMTNWAITQGNNSTIVLNNSRMNMTITTANSYARLFKDFDWLPLRLQFKGNINQRVTGQTIYFGCMSADYKKKCVAVFNGTDNTKVLFRTSNEDTTIETQETLVTLPISKKTNEEHIYTFEATVNGCSLLIDGMLLATHQDHVPGSYNGLGAVIDAVNSESTATTTTLSLDWVTVTSINQLDTMNSMTTTPLQVNLVGPKSLDNKPFISTTPRPFGTYTYLSSQGDGSTSQAQVGGGTKLVIKHSIGDTTAPVYFDINAVVNETHINTAILQWKGALNDEVQSFLVPKVTPSTIGTGYNYNIYPGTAVVVAAAPGTGTVDINLSTAYLVETTINEYNISPPGFWDATYNTTSNQFENITPNAYGKGKYNIFVSEAILFAFVPCFTMLGDGLYEIKSSDESRVGHNMRVKCVFNTNTSEGDHVWYCTAAMALYRKRTV